MKVKVENQLIFENKEDALDFCRRIFKIDADRITKNPYHMVNGTICYQRIEKTDEDIKNFDPEMKVINEATHLEENPNGTCKVVVMGDLLVEDE